ncbi:MAG: carbohydrate ABC transporter permease [Clostridiales bacterium]|nr:carbohydrate ABC transporter permease [Clostridiales bacterium]
MSESDMTEAKKNPLSQTLLKKTGRALYLALLYTIVIGLAFLILYPYLVKIATSFMSLDDLSDPTVRFIPKNISFYFWQRAAKGMNILTSFGTSLYIAGITALLQVMSCAFAGYGFARFKFVGRNLLFFLVIFTMLVPFTTIMLPYYLKFRYFNVLFTKLNLINTIWPNVVLSVTGLGLKNGLYIYMMRQFFRSMPSELEEAAYIDGAGLFGTYFRIMLPNAFVTMNTVFLLAFCWQWTDTTYASVFFSTKPTVVNALKNIVLVVGQDLAAVSSLRNIGTLIVMAPLALLYAFVQRSFIQGIERSGIAN